MRDILILIVLAISPLSAQAQIISTAYNEYEAEAGNELTTAPPVSKFFDPGQSAVLFNEFLSDLPKQTRTGGFAEKLTTVKVQLKCFHRTTVGFHRPSQDDYSCEAFSLIH